MICPNCGTTNPLGQTACIACGQILQTPSGPSDLGPPPVPDSVICPNCQTPNMPGAPTCFACGQPLPAGSGPSTLSPGLPPPIPAGSPYQPFPGGPVVSPPGYSAGPTGPLGPGPRSVLAGSKGALIGIGGVLVLGLVIWLAFLRPGTVGAGPGPGPGPGPRPTQTGGPGPTGPGPREVAIDVKVCGSLDQTGTCLNEGNRRSVSETQIVVRIQVTNAEAGSSVQLDLIDVTTRQAVVSPTTWSTSGAQTEILYSTITAGPQGFPQIVVEAVVTFKGTRLEFNPPVIITIQ